MCVCQWSRLIFFARVSCCARPASLAAGAGGASGSDGDTAAARRERLAAVLDGRSDRARRLSKVDPAHLQALLAGAPKATRHTKPPMVTPVHKRDPCSPLTHTLTALPY